MGNGRDRDLCRDSSAAGSADLALVLGGDCLSISVAVLETAQRRGAPWQVPTDIETKSKAQDGARREESNVRALRCARGRSSVC